MKQSALYIFQGGNHEHGNLHSALSFSAFTSRIIFGKQSQLQQNQHQKNKPLTKLELMEGCNMGIDTHADSSCAGRHVRILEYIEGKEYSVTPFHNDYKPISNVKMINGIVAVDTDDGNGYILELNHFLDFTNSMDNIILVPMQARINGINVDDVPLQLCPHKVSTQSIHFPDEDIRIPILFILKSRSRWAFQKSFMKWLKKSSVGKMMIKIFSC